MIHDPVKKCFYRLSILFCLVFTGLAHAASIPHLPADQAFRFAYRQEPGALVFVWDIADGYHLYRQKFAFTAQSPLIELGTPVYPPGEKTTDEAFGIMETYHGHLELRVPLNRRSGDAGQAEIKVRYQGCAVKGACYPPMQKTVQLDLPAGVAGPAPAAAPAAHPDACEAGPATGFVETAPVSEQCQIASALRHDSIWITAASFLGMGLLLAFTPCVFPMIPILSGIIVGHGHTLTTRRAFLLSLSYVIASALAYTVFGILAGLFGHNLQAWLQEPWIIGAFSGLFILLALAMFDLITLQVPAALQARLSALSHRQPGGTLLGAGLMGALSALIVGPCVAAPLAGALIYIGQTGDALLGGIALFALGLGMGLPLLLIGASAGKLLPRAGAWMNAVKAGFGVGLLAIATWLLDRILPPAVTLLLWSLLLIIPAIYLGALDPLPSPASGWRKFWKGLGIVLLAYGLLLLIGVASNSTDPLQPLRHLQNPAAAGHAAAPETGLRFRAVNSLTELQQQLAKARAEGRWVMLDYYADWCVSCKEMERYTFNDPRVGQALKEVTLLKADVTENSEANAGLLRHYNLIGPPATLFFGPDGEERRALRVVGYLEADAFLAHLSGVMQ